MPVETVDKRLDGGFVQVAQIGCCLTGLVTHHECLWVDEAESIDDDFALNRLYGVDYDGDGARCELLEGLLRVYVDAGEPASKPRVGVVPAYDCLWSAISS